MDIKKALKGEKIRWYPNALRGKPEYLPAVGFSAFNHYYEIWEDFHVLRVLPHGRGTLHERRGIVNIIKTFEKAYNDIKALLQEKANRG